MELCSFLNNILSHKIFSSRNHTPAKPFLDTYRYYKKKYRHKIGITFHHHYHIYYLYLYGRLFRQNWNLLEWNWKYCIASGYIKERREKSLWAVERSVMKAKVFVLASFANGAMKKRWRGSRKDCKTVRQNWCLSVLTVWLWPEMSG